MKKKTKHKETRAILWMRIENKNPNINKQTKQFLCQIL
jgi:hypothetical protein